MRSPDFYRQFGVYGGGVFFAVTSLAQPFFTLYAQKIGASTGEIGWLITLRSLFPIFVALPAGQLIDLLGPIRMLKYGSLFLIASLAVNAMATNLWMLALSQVLLGVCMVVMASSFQVLVSEGPKEKRNASINRYSMWMSGGTMVGPLIGGGLSSLFATELDGYRFNFIFSCSVSVLFLLTLLAVSRGYVRESARDEGGGMSVRDVFKPRGIRDSYMSGIHLTRNRAVQFGLTGTFLIMFIQVLYMGFIPIYLDELGYSTMLISLIVSVKGLAGMLARFVLNWIMKIAPLERILIVAGFSAAICLIVTPIGSMLAATMVVLAFLMGAATGINMPVSIMIMVNDTAESERGRLMGLRLLVNRFSQVVSPALFGSLGAAIGLTAAFYSGGALLLATMGGFSLYSKFIARKNADYDAQMQRDLRERPSVQA